MYQMSRTKYVVSPSPGTGLVRATMITPLIVNGYVTCSRVAWSTTKRIPVPFELSKLIAYKFDTFKLRLCLTIQPHLGCTKLAGLTVEAPAGARHRYHRAQVPAATVSVSCIFCRTRTLLAFAASSTALIAHQDTLDAAI